MTHTVNNQQFSTNVLTCVTREEYHWTGEILWLAPPSSGDALRNLTKAHGVSEELFVPG